MPSSSSFHLRAPNESDPNLSTNGPELEKTITSPRGTFPFLHPTHAHVHFDARRLDWNSRDHRKGRHPLEHGQRRRIRTILRLEWWNISWWVAVLFTLGSAVWVINGFFVFLPSLHVMGNNVAAEGWTAFVGGSLFEVGSYLMILESLNRRHEICFGDAVHQVLSKCTHDFHRRSMKKLTDDGTENSTQQWIWYGARWHEIGFIGSSIQFVAATIFWISTFTGIPGVIDMTNIGLVDGIFWVPQVIGGIGFIISSLLFLLETQPNWYHIRPFDSLGWHVGFWNLVGAVGFTLCGAFGIAEAYSWAGYQSSCSTFWGGWAFLIGSICQWIECLNR